MLTKMGKKNKKGEVVWNPGGVMSIIKNEKYNGDLLLGKTFTVDPIGKRRIVNMGEEKMYLTRDHHEAIVSREVWNKAQEIRRERNKGRIMEDNGMRECNTGLYTFSSKCECGYCGHKLTRRTRQQNAREYKPVWQCLNATKNGIASCPNCKSIDESVIEGAFLDALRQLIDNYDDIFEGVLTTVESVLQDGDDHKRIGEITQKIKKLETRKSRLTECLLDGTIDKEEYEKKIVEYKTKLNKHIAEKELLIQNSQDKKSIRKRMQGLRHVLKTQDPLDKFDRIVFDSIVEKVIVGGFDSEGKPAPYKLTFVLKSDQTLTADYDRKRYKEKQKEMKRKGRVS